MTDQNTTSRRWTRWLLVGSLALNLAVLGVVAGAFIQGGKDARGGRLDLTVGPLTRAMDSADREALRETLRDSGVFRPSDRAAIRTDMAALLDVLKADTFDPEAFRETLLRQRLRLQGGQDQMLDAITAQIDAMSPEARAAFADRLQDQLRRGPAQRDSNLRDDGSRHTRSGG